MPGSNLFPKSKQIHVPCPVTAQEQDLHSAVVPQETGTKKCCRLVAMLCNNYKTRRVQGSENSQGMWTVKSPALRKRPGGGGSNCKIIGKGQAFNKTVLAGTFYSHS